jgi:hypothetical protein
LIFDVDVGGVVAVVSVDVAGGVAGRQSRRSASQAALFQ